MQRCIGYAIICAQIHHRARTPGEDRRDEVEVVLVVARPQIPSIRARPEKVQEAPPCSAASRPPNATAEREHRRPHDPEIRVEEGRREAVADAASIEPPSADQQQTMERHDLLGLEARTAAPRPSASRGQAPGTMRLNARMSSGQARRMIGRRRSWTQIEGAHEVRLEHAATAGEVAQLGITGTGRGCHPPCPDARES